MSTPEEKQALIQTHVQQLNEGDVSGYMRMYAPDCAFHGYPPDVSPDCSGVAQFYTALVEAFPGAQVAPADVVTEGDRVAVRYTLTGTHTGTFLGAPPTGKAISVEGITILRFEGGKVAERWNRLDELTLLTKIGALPAATEAPAARLAKP